MYSLPAAITDFMRVFTDAGYLIYVAGGPVRDLVLGREVTDWDFTTSATPEQILALFPDSFYHNTYGTVTVKYLMKSNYQLLINNYQLFEVTPFRREGTYTDGRHPDEVRWAQTLDEDLSRRDFTIGAMAYDGSKIIDLHGGQEDLKNQVIRAVGDPDKRFQEDALRMLRAIRFSAQLGFLIEPQTLESIKKNTSLIQKISWERIRDEFYKILLSPHPTEGILFLRSTSLLKHILPELDVCFEVPQKSPGRHHIYDVGTHLVKSLEHCTSTNVITRFATLIHDIGKAPTFHKDPATQMITFYNHEVVGERMAASIAERFRMSKDERDLFVRLVAQHQFVVSEELTDNAIRRFIRNVGRENLNEMFALRHADRLGGAASETSWRTELFKKRVAELLIEPFTVKDLKIDGNDVMKILNLKPSRQVGDMLDALFEKVVNKEIENDRDILLNELTHVSQK
ncbi:MAG: HD domain-containing protein [Candidatus Roizmanbacteria bacterium]